MTSCEIVQIVITGPPRWGEKKAWIVQDGPQNDYKQLAGPFTARRDALDALAEVINAAHRSRHRER